MSQIDANDIVEVFDQVFYAEYCTSLRSGAAEPYYEVTRDGALIHFREDFVASALHEVAHWCLAGAERRQLNDYGYWYEGQRDRTAQRRFEAVETRPQALEWIFSRALGLPFRVSADNLDLPGHDTKPFRTAVRDAALSMLKTGLNQRSQRFAEALAKLSGRGCLQFVLQAKTFQEIPN